MATTNRSETHARAWALVAGCGGENYVPLAAVWVSNKLAAATLPWLLLWLLLPVWLLLLLGCLAAAASKGPDAAAAAAAE